MKKAVIFDLDGTLWNPCKEVAISWNLATKDINIEEITLERVEGLMGKNQQEIAKDLFSSFSIEEGLEILNKSNDGFYIASEDLKLRGPGDLFGIRQSGILDFKLGDVFQDAKVLQRASESAEKLMRIDPQLEFEENKNLKQYLQYYIKQGMIETTL